MTRHYFKSSLLCLTGALLILSAVGCGGGGSTGGAPSATASLPQPGNYEGPISSIGSAQISATSSGQLSIVVTLTQMNGTFTGSTSLAPNNTFSTLLTNSYNGQTTTATGTTYPAYIRMSLTGGSLAADHITATEITASFVGVN